MADKPILFNTEMVKAILDGRKTTTRRLLKQPFEVHPNGYITKPRGNERLCPYEPPYVVGDTLWVRETWATHYDGIHDGLAYCYKADGINLSSECLSGENNRWYPSIHMPREAARLFLKVTDVRVERLQDITEEQAKSEGVITNDAVKVSSYRYWFEQLWDSIYAAPCPVKEKGVITHYISYPWKDTRETREYKGLPWIVYGNPWVWANSFERIR